MTTWIIKSETDDPDRALANVAAQRGKGYTAWIEDENGTHLDKREIAAVLGQRDAHEVRGAPAR